MARPTYEELKLSCQEFISSRTGITAWSEGSTANILVSMFASQLSNLYDQLEQAEAARDISSANSVQLDNIGRSFGIIRRSSTASGSDSGSSQLIFTNTNNTTQTIPAGTSVWNSSNPSNRVYTTSLVVVGPGQSATAFVSAQTVGVSTSIGVNQLTSHNGPNGVLVNNFLPITDGTDLESDDAFRFRITETLNAAVLGGPSSLAGVQAYMSNLPGVASAVLMPQSRGPGTLDAVIVPLGSYLPDDDFLTSMTEQLASVAAAGVSVQVLAPTSVWISTNITISIGSMPLSSQSSLKTIISNLTENYINSRTVGLPVDAYNPNGVTNINSNIIYSDLLNSVTNAAKSILGTSLSNVVISFNISGDDTLQGDLYANPLEAFRSKSVSVSITQ